jgi:hypothetical protein
VAQPTPTPPVQMGCEGHWETRQVSTSKPPLSVPRLIHGAPTQRETSTQPTTTRSWGGSRVGRRRHLLIRLHRNDGERQHPTPTSTPASAVSGGKRAISDAAGPNDDCVVWALGKFFLIISCFSQLIDCIVSLFSI